VGFAGRHDFHRDRTEAVSAFWLKLPAAMNEVITIITPIRYATQTFREGLTEAGEAISDHSLNSAWFKRATAVPIAFLWTNRVGQFKSRQIRLSPVCVSCPLDGLHLGLLSGRCGDLEVRAKVHQKTLLSTFRPEAVLGFKPKWCRWTSLSSVFALKYPQYRHFSAERSAHWNGALSQMFRCAGQGVSVHQNLQESKIDSYVFWDQNLCIVFDAYSPISLTGIDKVKHLSIIYIHIILYY
jgi:hypothetical protein